MGPGVSGGAGWEVLELGAAPLLRGGPGVLPPAASWHPQVPAPGPAFPAGWVRVGALGGSRPSPAPPEAVGEGDVSPMSPMMSPCPPYLRPSCRSCCGSKMAWGRTERRGSSGGMGGTVTMCLGRARGGGGQ